MSAAVVRSSSAAGLGVLEHYAEVVDIVGGEASYRRDRLTVAAAFAAEHPDLGAWMARPVADRLVELSRRPHVWPFVAFALLEGICPGDADFLFAKNFGHSAIRMTTVLFAESWRSLNDAAERLGSASASREALRSTLPLAVMLSGKPPGRLDLEDLDALGEAIDRSPRLNTAGRRSQRGHLFALRKLLFEAGITDLPAEARRQGGPATRSARLGVVSAVEVRRTILAYLDARAAVLRPKSIDKLTSALAIFGEFISDRFPEVTCVAGLERRHIEEFLTWTASRPSRRSPARDRDRKVGPFVAAHAAISLRGFLDDIAAWGWADAPTRRLVFSTDIPRQPDTLPRALPPDVDAALMAAVANLADPFARVGLTVLRGSGLRIGELVDLELDCIVDYGPAGSWLRVPLGKLNSERTVPLDAGTLDALDEWFAHRQRHRAMPHPRSDRMADFVFVEAGRRLGPRRLQTGLRQAVLDAGLTANDGEPLRVVAHQLRHTYATSLVNAGMSLQALMALLGHRSPEMTIRYARLASPTLRAAYDEAIGKVRHRIPVTTAGRTAVPGPVEWLQSEMLKTRVAHGYCSRDLVAEACAYANICETCPNFTTTAEFAPALTDQLDDLHALRDDADERGWTSEAARHRRVISSLEGHLQRLANDPSSTPRH